MSGRLSPQQGFTLIELLCAIAIVAVIGGLITIAFAGTLRLREHVETEGGRDHMARSALALMAEELGTARAIPGAPWIGRDAQREGQDADIVVFNSTAHVPTNLEAREADCIRLVYTREGDRLVRAVKRNLRGFTTEVVDQVDVAVGVVAFNVRYYDRAARLWMDGWIGQGKGQPAAVLIELTLENGRHEMRIFREWVTIRSQSN